MDTLKKRLITGVWFMRTLICSLLFLFMMIPAQAAKTVAETLPEPLQPWVDWVMYEKEASPCPSLYNRIGQQGICAWPSPLELELKADGGRFAQSWEVEEEGWLELPGDEDHWPLEVIVDGKSALVSDHNGSPAVFLEPGRHRLRGSLLWSQLPERLKLPANVALVQLSIRNKAVPFPHIDEQGQVWLREQQQQQASQEQAENRHSLNVYRLVMDGVPLKVVTHIDINVSGEARELAIGPVVLPGSIPLGLNSRLPVKLEADGQLKLQARPGRWAVELISRYPGEIASITLPEGEAAWQAQEIWAWQADSAVRLAEVRGLEQVDPRQTKLPQHWQNLPAYRIQAGQSMQFDVQHRGNPLAPPNNFRLTRQLWLDFDGDGYTVADSISGVMNQGWRLNMFQPYQLGRVAINGEDQVITHQQNEEGAGVEIRQNQLDLRAEGRLEQDTIPSLGWDSDFQSANGELYLPPGWTLLAMGGVDQVSNSWIKKWTLLDIFLVLVISLGIKRLWSWQVAAVALVLLTLTWHETGAPRLIWLNLVIAIALWRVLPVGRMKHLINGYRWVSVAVLLLMFLAYAIDAVREGLYPQLENPYSIYQSSPLQPPATLDYLEKEIASDEEFAMRRAPQKAYEMAENLSQDVQSALPSSAYSRGRAEGKAKAAGGAQLMTQQVIDPKAQRQTGPGLPRWKWQNIRFAWNGPVKAGQGIEPYLITPSMHLLLNLLAVILMGVLTAFMAGLEPGKRPGLPFGGLRSLALLVLCSGLLLMPAPPAQAAGKAMQLDDSIPDEAILKELQRRLLNEQNEPPECAPQCAQSPRLFVEVKPQQLSILMEVHAGAEVAVPLPMETNQWLPEEVSLDGGKAVGVHRLNNHYYALVPEGIHRIRLRGALPELSSVRIPLPLNPHHIETRAEGWQVQGITDGRAAGQIQLLRQSKRSSTVGADGEKEEATYETQALPPLVRIERTLLLGIDWNVSTTVTRLSGQGDTIELELPLLAGESVLSGDAKVKNGRISITLAANQNYYQWNSTLEKQGTLKLQAADTTQWLEHWRLSVSPIWRTEYAGIPEIKQQSSRGDWMPQWWPWPGEQVDIQVFRPEGVVGATLTIDETRMDVTPGSRATEVVYSMQLRSSQGEQRELALPDGATLQKLVVDGIEQSLPQGLDKVPLTITPGSHDIEMIWQQEQGISSRFTTPTLSLGQPSVNHNISLSMPQDRWILFTGGPSVGPAVLFWGVLIVILLFAIGLGKSAYTPLKTRHWVLLGIGFSQAPVWMVVFVVAWFFLLAHRERQPADVSDGHFNGMQVFIVFATFLAFWLMFYAIWQGLLGLPHMQIEGNGSWEYGLNWYQDHASDTLPQAWVISVPLMVYRLLMLAWSLWLAFAMLRWVQWGWRCYSHNGLWRKLELPVIKKRAAARATQKTEQDKEE